jgi:DNA invertase Pin-like site-specific DNA recombinase
VSADKTITAAIYARVSTTDKGQDVENQLVELRRYARTQRWQIREFIDHATGKHADRAQFQAMFEAASRREFTVVVVWALDRFTREGIGETFAHLKRLRGYGVQFESYSEPQFRTTGPFGELFAELMIALAAWFAKTERQRISDRTKAGLATARAKGKTLGRPWKVFSREKAIAMRKEGVSWRDIARELGVGESTIRHVLKSAQQTSPKKRAKR